MDTEELDRQLLIEQFYFNFELCYSTKSTKHSHEDPQEKLLAQNTSHKSLHELKEEENQAFFFFLDLWQKWDGYTAVGDVSGWSVFG